MLSHCSVSILPHRTSGSRAISGVQGAYTFERSNDWVLSADSESVWIQFAATCADDKASDTSVAARGVLIALADSNVPVTSPSSNPSRKLYEIMFSGSDAVIRTEALVSHSDCRHKRCFLRDHCCNVMLESCPRSGPPMAFRMSLAVAPLHCARQRQA